MDLCKTVLSLGKAREWQHWYLYISPEMVLIGYFIFVEKCWLYICWETVLASLEKAHQPQHWYLYICLEMVLIGEFRTWSSFLVVSWLWSYKQSHVVTSIQFSILLRVLWTQKSSLDFSVTSWQRKEAATSKEVINSATFYQAPSSGEFSVLWSRTRAGCLAGLPRRLRWNGLNSTRASVVVFDCWAFIQ